MSEGHPSLDYARLEAAYRLLGDDPDHLLAIVGSTASGKTELAVRLAERVGGEIVGVDSVQVYRGFDVGSGKPSAEERSRAPHHLIDVWDPLEAVDAVRFAAQARAAIADIRQRGRRAIVCGGTFLWVKALLFGLADAPPANEAVRARHREICVREGRPALHAALAKVDPVAAARLHPNDAVRVSRALEVFELTGGTLTCLQADHGFRAPRYRATLVAPEVPFDILTERITARVQRFVAAGWVDEVRSLTAAGFGEARPMASVGYREVRTFLAGGLAEADLAPAVVRATRVFARRQRTFLRSAAVTWL